MNIATLIINQGSCTDLLVVFEDDNGAMDLTGYTIGVTDCVPAALSGIIATVVNPIAGEVEFHINEAVSSALRLGDNWFRMTMIEPNNCIETTNKIRLLVQ